jgi:hypothetical protein
VIKFIKRVKNEVIPSQAYKHENDHALQMSFRPVETLYLHNGSRYGEFHGIM